MIATFMYGQLLRRRHRADNALHRSMDAIADNDGRSGHLAEGRRRNRHGFCFVDSLAGNRLESQRREPGCHVGPGTRRGTVKRFWTALAIVAVIGVALFLLAAADAGASRALGAAFFFI